MANYDDLLQIPAELIKSGTRSQRGDLSPGQTLSIRCYASHETEEVVTREGDEIVSNTTFYFEPFYYDENGNEFDLPKVEYDDKISFYDDTYEVKSHEAIRDIDGTLLLWVVYT